MSLVEETVPLLNPFCRAWMIGNGRPISLPTSVLTWAWVNVGLSDATQLLAWLTRRKAAVEATSMRRTRWAIVPASPWRLLIDRSEEHTSELQSRQYLVC